jgi:hypothetical protein
MNIATVLMCDKAARIARMIIYCSIMHRLHGDGAVPDAVAPTGTFCALGLAQGVLSPLCAH